MPPSFNPNDIVPRGLISLQLMRGSESVAQWSPFETLIPESMPLDSVPFLLRSQIAESSGIRPLVYQRGTFNAIMLGEYMATADVPVSAEPVLEFVLRDPPGDASSCSIVQGSSVSFEKKASFSTTDTRSRNQDYQLIPTASFARHHEYWYRRRNHNWIRIERRRKCRNRTQARVFK